MRGDEIDLALPEMKHNVAGIICYAIDEIACVFSVVMMSID